MSKQPKCWRCRLPAPELEHLYRRHDGRRYCMPCIVLLVYEAEVVEANKQLDAWVERHTSHE